MLKFGVGVIIFIGILVSIIAFIIDNHYWQFVIKNSVALKELDMLNKKFCFSDIANFYEEHTYDNEKMFDDITCVDYLTYQLQFKQYEVLKQIGKVNNNKRMYDEYCDKINQINGLGKFLQPINRLKEKKLLTYEKYLFEKKKLHPQTNFSIKITLHLSTINGRIYYKKSESFDANQIKQLINRLNNKSGYFYIDKDIWNSICKVERGRVSNKMRFAVYNRDGYRCRICGKSGDFVDLEVDHIKPIAKGGKSTYDNLQTLCHHCNQMKGDSYYN